MGFLAGWLALFVLAFVVEKQLLIWSAKALGPDWFATARAILDCSSLAAAGWIVGRLAVSPWAAVAFAASLAFWDFNPTLILNVPWLLRQTWNLVGDSRFLEAWASGLATHAILFGCFYLGWRAARRRPSIDGLRIHLLSA